MFLLMAIALESQVLSRQLHLDYKTSVRYAASLNLFSTSIGWLLFFGLEALLSPDLKRQLVGLIFFEQYFPNPWAPTVAPIVVLSSFVIFMGTFLLELQGLEWLERLLDKAPTRTKELAKEESIKFRGRRGQAQAPLGGNRAYALLLANAWSFSGILFLLLIRWFEQLRQFV